MKKQKLNISVVIPVYNEAETIKACIEALALQKEPLYEVIVVDNNSLDNSLELARSFNFVTVISEKNQGVSHARDKGFNVASGDIIARIDADTIVPRDWSIKLQKIFENDEIGAVSGSMQYRDWCYRDFGDKVDLLIRLTLNRSMGNQTFLQGCNMAVRKSAWQEVRGELCHHCGIHEDIDLAIHLQKHGFKVDFDPSLPVGVSARRFQTDFSSFKNYIIALPNTYQIHGKYRYLPIYALVALGLISFLPMRAVNRLFNPDSYTAKRIDPTSNIL
ncbi:MAG: glycosyltransferase family 2 protein [bacterium]